MHTNKTILLVDDDADDRFLFSQALASINAQVALTEAPDGAKALRLLQTAPALPHIIFMDMNMPVMNGLECLKQIKSNPAYRHIPVVMLSTAGHEGLQLQFHLYGAQAFSRKPIEFEDLCHMVASHLAAFQVATWQS